ncbi:MAG: hypothetical protein ACKPJD_32785 [Planctomycetaceae bacterium]
MPEGRVAFRLNRTVSRRVRRQNCRTRTVTVTVRPRFRMVHRSQSSSAASGGSR